ncbi:GIY-YIG nuclease family protein [Xylophilus ampelinus]|uniref:GIY-YIG catalytic domain-containing protein n=1 Tax=Xylophilus ampelinus TaxID=54067 RepID=A0A318SHZ1_9BURK|nr:GIY-YIG nuclease family protein [Xylophilus ampelinus]MCS4510384.1 GIY-YIG nuclease family protein [Xylophilus ampelinus]PYE77997.1 GIY-YIG catalytic domain-containing protein [Xylophilus ampelinus]
MNRFNIYPTFGLTSPGEDAINGVTPNVRTSQLPFETEALRLELARFLNYAQTFPDGQTRRIGGITWGVYAFFDYDNEPIYVGQTKESLGTRIRRHLTNQRTDAVAMNVLDPFEVHTIEVWPLPQFDRVPSSNVQAVQHLNALEAAVYNELLSQSAFGVVLNEKDPPYTNIQVPFPDSFRGRIVSAEVSRLRDHPDLRLARRALTLAKLAQVISERKVQLGLRRTLLAQATRLQQLANARMNNAADIPDHEAD